MQAGVGSTDQGVSCRAKIPTDNHPWWEIGSQTSCWTQQNVPIQVHASPNELSVFKPLVCSRQCLY